MSGFEIYICRKLSRVFFERFGIFFELKNPKKDLSKAERKMEPKVTYTSKSAKIISPWLKTNLIKGSAVKNCFSEKLQGYDVLTFQVHCYNCRHLLPVPNISNAEWRQKLGEYTWVILLGFDDHLVSNDFDNNVDLKALLANHCPRLPKVSDFQIIQATILEKVEELHYEYYDDRKRARQAVAVTRTANKRVQ